MKASRLVLFFACIASLTATSSRNLSVAPIERQRLRSNKGQNSVAKNNSRADLTRAAVTQLPLFFEANQGQTNPRIRFLSRGSGYTLFLTPTETVLAESRSDEGGGGHFVKAANATESRAVLRMKLAGANPAPVLTGVDELPGKVNYLIGNDPSAWHTGVPLYSQVRSEQVYPGVDLIFHGDEQQLEYDFVISPGADPGRVAFQIAGANGIELDRQGNLVLHTPNNEIWMHKPVAYQMIGGQRRPVEGNFVLRATEEIGFQIASYDRSQPLVIDPTISYATFLGGAGDDKGVVVVDTSTPGAPKVYVPGKTTDITTFPETSTKLGVSPGGTHYVFVAKVDPALTGAASLDYLTFIGGNMNFAGAAGCDVDASSAGLDTSLGPSSVEIVVGGTTNCENYPVTTGSHTSGPNDIFITRLHTAGNSIDVSIFFGGNGQELIGGGSLDSSGNVYIGSYTTSTDLPVTAGAYSTKLNNGSAGFEDCFVAKLSRSFVVEYLTYLNVGAGTTSGQSPDLGCFAAADPSGKIAVEGTTFSSTSLSVPNGFQTTFKGLLDLFLVELDPTLSGTSQRTYASYFGGGGGTFPGGGAFVKPGVIALAGNTESGTTSNPGNIPLTANAYQSTNRADAASSKGTGYVTVVDFSKTGAASLVFSSYFGGIGGDERIQALVYDAVPGNTASYRLVFGGQTTSRSLPLKNAMQSTLTGGQNGWLAVLDVPSSGSGAPALLFSSYVGGNYTAAGSQGTNEQIQGLGTDPAHTIYAAARTLSDNFFAETTPATTVNGFQSKCGSCFPTHASPVDDTAVFALPNPAQTATSTTALASSLNPSTAGQSVTFTATVIGVATPGTPTGTVTFKDGATTLSSVALSGGVAKFSTTTLSVATHSITAVYSGDPTFLTSTSAVLSQVVNSSGGGGAVTFTPTSLSFTQQLVGAKSAAKLVTLKNTGTGALTISSVVAVGNFSETNNCPASLAAGLTCTISVSFTPSVTGKVLGEVTVTDNSSGTTQEIGLSGNGVTPLNFSPTSLSFGTVTVGTTTAAKIVSVINNSTTSLTISGVASGGYAIAATGTTCVASLAAKAKCNLAVTFTPHYNGAINGALTLTYNAGFSPVEVPLSGSGTGGAVAPLTFTPTSLSFASQLTGTSSAAKVVTVTNSSASSVTINSVSASGDYSAVASGATPCSNGLALAATHTCTFSVTFKPSVNGTIPGAVWIADSSAQNPQVLSVTGKGVVSVSLSPSTLNFGTVSKNTVSAPKTITVTNNNQSTAVSITGIAVSGDYKFAAGTCTGSVAAKSKCTFTVSFAPLATGLINGVVSVSYASGGSPEVVNLSGTGQ